MKLGPVFRTLGLMVMAYSATLIPPILVALYYGDREVADFLISLFVILALGVGIWLPARNCRQELQNQSAFLIVAFFWCGLGLIGSLPFLFGGELGLVDAVFETISGFTTTGATVIYGLDHLPHSILYYREQLQWIGGIGVVVLALSVLPTLRVGGMQLLRAETPGAMREERLTPRIGQTARALWLVYVGITVACAVGFMLAGMTPFDAIGHSFATVSTGGFSTHDDSFAYFDSPAIEAVADVFMLIGGINFGLHFLAWRGGGIRQYLHDSEVKAFLVIIAGVTFVVSATLYLSGKYPSVLESVRFGLFEVISVITTTGFGVANFSTWPTAVPVMLIFLSFVGGCAGSTAGGIKVIRILMLVKQGIREFFLLSHPNAIATVKLNGRPVSERTISAIWSFFSIYVVTFAILMLTMMFTGLDQVTAFSAVATCMNNLGPGLGRVAVDFRDVSDAVKVIGVIAMILGRLEIFTILVLMSPVFWRR